jgi:phosphate starvation-inducible protein PhoH
VKKTKKPVTEQFAVEFADNRLAAMLSGPHQKNFARLEQRLDIRITQRGNRVALSGAERERGAQCDIKRGYEFMSGNDVSAGG